ncbi:MAG: hypothetical protein HY892_00915 [Deltaproteobacteria bacterium]|nr:hypothetical protein [Deltaproteobacteria bacterium]
MAEVIIQAVQEYVREVQEEKPPTEEHCYRMGGRGGREIPGINGPLILNFGGFPHTAIPDPGMPAQKR